MLTIAVLRFAFALPAVRIVPITGRLAADEDHTLAFGLVALVVAALFLVYLWKRRRLRRERS